MSLTIKQPGEQMKFAPDYFFRNTAMPNNATVTSEAKKAGSANGGLEVYIDIDATVTTTAPITVTWLTSDTADGTFTAEQTITIPAGAKTGCIARFIPIIEGKVFCKLAIASTENLSARKVTAYPVAV